MWTKFCQWLCASLHAALLVDTLQVIRMKPNDFIIIKCDKPLNAKQLECIRESWRRATEKLELPKHSMMMLDAGMDIEIVRGNNWQEMWKGQPSTSSSIRAEDIETMLPATE